MAKKFQPYVVQDPSRLTRADTYGKWLVIGPCFSGFRAVGHDYTYRHGTFDGVVDTVILERQLPQFSPALNTPLQSYVEELKNIALTKGATPLAVEWLGELVAFSKKDYDIMAEKLKTKKAPAAKAAKPAKAATGKKGNPEALAKAREARAESARADRSYKHEMTPAKALETTREGSWTRRMVEIIMSHKSTNDAKDELAKDKEYGDRRLDFAWAATKGYIKLS